MTRLSESASLKTMLVTINDNMMEMFKALTPAATTTQPAEDSIDISDRLLDLNAKGIAYTIRCKNDDKLYCIKVSRTLVLSLSYISSIYGVFTVASEGWQTIAENYGLVRRADNVINIDSTLLPLLSPSGTRYTLRRMADGKLYAIMTNDSLVPQRVYNTAQYGKCIVDQEGWSPLCTNFKDTMPKVEDAKVAIDNARILAETESPRKVDAMVGSGQNMIKDFIPQIAKGGKQLPERRVLLLNDDMTYTIEQRVVQYSNGLVIGAIYTTTDGQRWIYLANQT